jgi:hypothetical protein
MEHNTSFDSQKAELLELVKREPDAFSDRDGLTPLQQRKLRNEEMRFSDLVLEEELCAEMHMDILELNDAQIDRFVKFALDNNFPGHCLRRRFDQTYFQVKVLKEKPDLSDVSYALLMNFVVQLGEYDPTPGEVLNNPRLASVKEEEPGLFLELLFQLKDPSYYERELIDNYEKRYGYGVFALGCDRLVRRHGIDCVERILEGVKNHLTPDELKWRHDFITEHKA